MAILESFTTNDGKELELEKEKLTDGHHVYPILLNGNYILYCNKLKDAKNCFNLLKEAFKS